jgi:4-hydroxythreonine-4-phosphate dehydrogenase
MITVLADDLSGAAEAAGACHTRGLPAEVQTAPRPTSAAALCLDADTRSLPPPAAQERSAHLAAALRDRSPLIFKKADSLLRGPIAAEVAGLLAALLFRSGFTAHCGRLLA